MISERDKARYPFTTESADYVKKLRIEVDDLITEPYKPILKRAEERIRLALLKPDDLTPQEHDPSIEILSLSFSIGNFFPTSSSNTFLFNVIDGIF